jgi:hypothetical protein
VGVEVGGRGWIKVGVGEGVGVGVWVGVQVAVGVAVAVAVAVGVWVGVGDGVNVGVEVLVGVFVGVRVAVGVGVGASVGSASVQAVCTSTMAKTIVMDAVCHLFRECGIEGPPGEKKNGFKAQSGGRGCSVHSASALSEPSSGSTKIVLARVRARERCVF